MTIGDDLWYPMWHDSQIIRASNELTTFFPETTKIEYYNNFRSALTGDELSNNNFHVMRSRSTKFSSSISEESSVDDRPRFSTSSSVRTISSMKSDSRSFERVEGDAISVVWDLLHNPVKIKDQEGLQSYLLTIGITNQEELQFFDEESIEDISKFLKKIPEKAFRFYMKKIKEQMDQVEG
jgi:hypothetical protein